MPSESQPFGPEDQLHPDRAAQVDAVPATHERGGRRRPADVRGDSEDDAWKAEATFGEDAVGAPTDADRDDPDVDPIVHRGE